MNNDDRRVRKTRKALREALAKLMTQKELRYITVRELTEVADVHRATFYAHYQDVNDLYEQLENSVLTELDEMIDSSPTNSYDSVYRAIINYVYANAEIWNMLFGNHGNKNFQNNVCELVEKKFLNIWLLEENKRDITDEMRYLTTYHIQGCIAIISLWVNSSFSSPKENLIELICKVNDSFDRIIL